MINRGNQGLIEFPPIAITEDQIRLEKNKIQEIPKDIGSFQRLTHLYLRYNNITSIPSEIGKAKNLRVLLLSNNEISELPSELGTLHKLSQLRINNNKIEKLPKELGNLENLTHLFIENNNLTYIPEELRNLKKLVHFSANGNKFKLPPNYTANKPKETIDFILQHQDPPQEDSLITNKAFYFLNASQENIIKNYTQRLEGFAIDNNVELISIQSDKEVNNNTNVVFIVLPLDLHKNPSLAHKIAKKCQKLNTRLFILVQDQFIDNELNSVNLNDFPTIQKVQSDLKREFANEFNPFGAYEEFNNLMFEALKQHKPNINIRKLTIKNIGHFEELEITFNSDITCLIGENGSGKSTILKAIALSIIGGNHKSISDKAKRNLLRIVDFDKNKLFYQDGLISLDYTIDGDIFNNTVRLIAKDNGNDIEFLTTEDSQIIYNNYYLKSLIVGFPQERGMDKSNDENLIKSKNTQPHINDLIPLINGSDEHRLRSFSDWIANLYFDSINKREVESIGNTEIDLITVTFQVISEITKKEIKFKTVNQVAPPDVWVTTTDSPNGIPLNLVSQGFRIMIGWIGHLMQRFIDTFPLSEPLSAFKENAIVLIDEIDISMHPLWQISFIDVLRKLFPNTQFICSTHDPLIIGGLLKEQIRVFNDIGYAIEVFEPEMDPKGQGVSGILTSELFGLKSTIDQETLRYIERRNELIVKRNSDKLSEDEKIELNDIFHYLLSLGINTTDRDPLYEQFLIALNKRMPKKIEKYTPKEFREMNKIANQILDDILNEEGK